jgi:hypothetical protein
MVWTIFEYLYRDAGNFKAFGCVALCGAISAADREMIRTKLDAGEHFVSEQVGVPPLYEQLYQFSDGSTVSDHSWHEFVSFRECEALETDFKIGGTAKDFVRRFASVNEWDLSLSPHFKIAQPI